ncbi:hypothetical protein HY312_01585, partial [Candidatus Saccharibacteria bacterium]|nr:hypothetical protein [Candidatus Saccharibacteria bacterium]
KLFCRSGFIVTNDDKIRGRFFEEGLAEYVASRYRRRMVGDQNTLGIVSVPSLAIPEYLVQPDHAMTSGPDGYAIELLAYGVEKKGIMNAEMFTELLLDTRRNNTRLVALRTFAQVLERLETGLYSKLQFVAYDKTSWQDACAYVHSVVTR